MCYDSFCVTLYGMLLFYSKRSAMQRLEEQIKPFEGQADPGSVSPLHSLSLRSGKARQTDPRSARGGAQRADVTRREAKRAAGEL